MFKRLALFVVFFALNAAVHAVYQDPELEVSTQPIGSSYYRHLAQMTGIDLRELEKFEKRGFGRTEINVLILISSGSVQTLKDYGNRRLKDRVPLNDLIKEANRDLDDVYASARALKSEIEAKGDQDLPPPIYEMASSTTTVVVKKEKKKQKENPIDAPKPPPAPPQ